MQLKYLSLTCLRYGAENISIHSEQRSNSASSLQWTIQSLHVHLQMAFGVPPRFGRWPVCHGTQIANLARNARSAGLPPPNLPGPEQAKTFAVPADHRLWLTIANAKSQSLQIRERSNPQHPVGWGQAWSFIGRALNDTDLVSEREDLQLRRRHGIGTCLGEQRAVGE